MLAWLLILSLIANGLLISEMHKARAKVRWLLSQPLSFWEWRERHRRMMKAVEKAALKLRFFANSGVIVAPPGGGIVKVRRPPPFEEKAKC